MATIKRYTDLDQSRKLAGILPIESADMYIDSTNPYYIHTELRHIERFDSEHDPCWSLAALLGVFPFYEINNNGVNIQLSVKGEALITEKEECLLDLVVNMIINLHELKML